MNPRAQMINQDSFPPLAEVRKNLRIPWYRCPITNTTPVPKAVAGNDAAGPLAASIGGLAPKRLI
jgi:hypothetical protein